ncbi:hypothetical protein F7734_24350 [Scytonema sp. UIC 10036]|uniref:hypothetical protein n=1 Tax=Scytonema sp. UIC 10036 TaxID=2304196 RepID=UPI0012DA87AD|nr:hypothetical protein [Scytonema sp. UIC 10036]MUG95325.1 hypothetical protein [Scytonema sp. UIC 10036]
MKLAKRQGTLYHLVPGLLPGNASPGGGASFVYGEAVEAQAKANKADKMLGFVPQPNLHITEVEFTPLNPPLERGEARFPVPSPFQGEG